MKGNSMDESILQRIDACRPGSGDAELAPGQDEPGRAPLADDLAANPEARQCYERVQQQDAKIRDAMRRIEPPAGLAERLLLALSAAEESAAENPPANLFDHSPGNTTQQLQPLSLAPASEVEASDGERQAHTPALSAAPGWLRDNRRRLAMAALAASMLLVAFGAWQWLRRPEQISLDTLVAEVVQVYRDVYQSESSSKPMRTLPPAFNIPARVLQPTTGLGWRETRLLNGKAVAIDLRGANPGVQATLLVAYANGHVFGAGMTTVPPWSPNSTTGGRCVGLWRSGDMVYALVVEGDTSAYHGFILQHGLV